MNPPRLKIKIKAANHAKVGRTKGRMGVWMEKMLALNATGEI